MPEARKLRATLASERGVSGYSVDGFNVNFAGPIAIQTAGAKIAFRPVGEATSFPRPTRGLSTFRNVRQILLCNLGSAHKCSHLGH